MSKGMKPSLEMEEPFYVRRKPDPVPFSKFLYNSEKGTVLGRTGSSWGKARRSDEGKLMAGVK
jgi:Sodium / potassium ATPase beta chain